MTNINKLKLILLLVTQLINLISSEILENNNDLPKHLSNFHTIYNTNEYNSLESNLVKNVKRDKNNFHYKRPAPPHPPPSFRPNFEPSFGPAYGMDFGKNYKLPPMLDDVMLPKKNFNVNYDLNFAANDLVSYKGKQPLHGHKKKKFNYPIHPNLNIYYPKGPIYQEKTFINPPTSKHRLTKKITNKLSESLKLTTAIASGFKKSVPKTSKSGSDVSSRFGFLPKLEPDLGHSQQRSVMGGVRMIFDLLSDPSLIVTVLHTLEVAYLTLPMGFLLMPIINFFRVPNRRRSGEDSKRSFASNLVKSMSLMNKIQSRSLDGGEVGEAGKMIFNDEDFFSLMKKYKNFHTKEREKILLKLLSDLSESIEKYDKLYKKKIRENRNFKFTLTLPEQIKRLNNLIKLWNQS